MRRVIFVSVLCFLCASVFEAQQPSNASDSKVRNVRVGVGLPLNESRFLVSGEWARNQVIRDLQTLKGDRKSLLTIEPVSLESETREDAIAEGIEKHCDYVLLTKIRNFKTGGVYVGPEGLETPPTLPGNVDSRREMDVDFTVIRPGHPNPIFEGRTAAPSNPPSTAAPSDNSTFEAAANQVALRVAKEIRKQPSQID